MQGGGNGHQFNEWTQELVKPPQQSTNQPGQGAAPGYMPGAGAGMAWMPPEMLAQNPSMAQQQGRATQDPQGHPPAPNPSDQQYRPPTKDEKLV